LRELTVSSDSSHYFIVYLSYRVFLDINPPEGVKKGSSKRTATSLPAAVRKLILDLEEELM